MVTVDAPHPAEKEVRRNLRKIKNIEYIAADVLETLTDIMESGKTPQFIHVAHTAFWKEAMEIIISHAASNTVVVLEDMGKKQKQEWWKQAIKDERVGVTFQLKKLGIMFFDKKMNKQHYVL